MEEEKMVQEQEEETFETLIRGKYKAEFDARVQKILDARLKGLKQENEMLRLGREERRNFRRRAVEALAAGEGEMRQVYGDFSWRAEMENPRFAALIGAGVAARDAYEVVHRETLMGKAMAFAARQAAEQMARSIASGGRVGENGGRSAAVSRSDPGGLTSEELSDIRQRVRKGEKIRF